MLIGLPGSGKSTWVRTSPEASGSLILSTDDDIEAFASAAGKTYNQVFSERIGTADANMKALLYYTIKNDPDRNIVWDQTNLTIRSRAKKLAMVPYRYRKVAVVFNCPPEVIQERLSMRTGKTIPPEVFDGMVACFEHPNLNENWNEIIYID